MQDKRREARRAVETATQAVEDAKANAVTFLTATINGTAGDAPASVKAARAALQEAEDNLETQRTLEESLDAMKPALQQSLDIAKSTVKNRIEAVVSTDPSLRKLCVDYKEMRRLIAQRQQLFSFLFSMIPREFQDWQHIISYGRGELADETPPWRAAIAELEHNSDAALPTV
jgi:hypothetical protein